MSKTQTLALARSMLRAAHQFADDNFREYAQRRVLQGFREHAALQDRAAVDAALAEAREQLAVLRRQTAISHMYTHTESVMPHQPAWRVKPPPLGGRPGQEA